MKNNRTYEQIISLLNSYGHKKIIDLRLPEEYAQGHLAGSVNIPFTEISTVQGFILDLNTPIFLYCQSGKHSRSAKDVLRYLGYRYVFDIGGVALP
ncbi:MAG: rhodanese-like domain-containing protein [Clostridiales bacterium]|nr:rhodanese-like domain-containing protein [Clostridiales bacterium]